MLSYNICSKPPFCVGANCAFWYVRKLCNCIAYGYGLGVTSGHITNWSIDNQTIKDFRGKSSGVNKHDDYYEVC